MFGLGTIGSMKWTKYNRRERKLIKVKYFPYAWGSRSQPIWTKICTGGILGNFITLPFFADRLRGFLILGVDFCLFQQAEQVVLTTVCVSIAVLHVMHIRLPRANSLMRNFSVELIWHSSFTLKLPHETCVKIIHIWIFAILSIFIAFTVLQNLFPDHVSHECRLSILATESRAASEKRAVGSIQIDLWTHAFL